MRQVIGELHWDACETCRHYPTERGGCAVDRETWRDSLTIEYDSVKCGSYEPRQRAEEEKEEEDEVLHS
jgi:hypothetical protein